jgi:hypothetical protein
MEQDPLLLVEGAERTKEYKRDAKKRLESKFLRVSCLAINAVLVHVKFDVRTALQILSEIDRIGDTELVFPQMPTGIRVFLKNDRRIRDPVHKGEVQQFGLDEAREDDPHPSPNKSEATEFDMLLECGCCFNEYERAEMEECTANEGHLICKNCIIQHVREQLDGNNSTNFRCIADANCHHKYHQANVLDKVLPPDLAVRTDEAIFCREVEEAGLQGAW